MSKLDPPLTATATATATETETAPTSSNHTVVTSDVNVQPQLNFQAQSPTFGLKSLEVSGKHTPRNNLIYYDQAEQISQQCSPLSTPKRLSFDQLPQKNGQPNYVSYQGNSFRYTDKDPISPRQLSSTTTHDNEAIKICMPN